MRYLQSEKVDDSWSFKELDRSETSYLTHTYHTYPAKFIPQLATRLISKTPKLESLYAILLWVLEPPSLKP